MYTSIIGKRIKLPKTPVTTQINREILEYLTCPISREIMKKPVYIPESQQIYDHPTILQWLLTHNTDPITNIKLKLPYIDYIPCLNYFILLLCLEEKNDTLYYHHPYSNLISLLEFASYYYNDKKLDYINYSNRSYTKSTYDHTKFNGLSDVFFLDVRDYFPRLLINRDNKLIPFHNIEPTDKALYINCDDFRYLTIQDLFRCPITYRSTFQNCHISKSGAFCHSKTLKIFINGHISSFQIGIVNENHRVNCSDIYKIINFAIKEDDFDVSYSSFDTSRAIIPYGQQHKVKNLMVSKIKTSCVDPSCYFERDEQKTYLFNEILIDAHNFFVKYRNIIHQPTQYKLSQLFYEINNMQHEKYEEIYVWTEEEYHKKFDRTRVFFNFPSYYGPEQFYGFDISFLYVQNQKFSRSWSNMCCIGTIFENCEFYDMIFTSCNFVDAVLVDTTFKNCEFNHCTLYKIDKSFRKSTSLCMFDEETDNTFEKN